MEADAYGDAYGVLSDVARDVQDGNQAGRSAKCVLVSGESGCGMCGANMHQHEEQHVDSRPRMRAWTRALTIAQERVH